MDADFKSWVLQRRIKQLGDKFDWSGFTGNPDVTLKLVKENMDKPWNWALFGNHILSTVVTDVPLEFYLTNGRKALAGEFGVVNFSFAKYHQKGFHLGHIGVRYNRKVHVEHLIKFKGTPHDWCAFSENPNFEFKHVLDYPDKCWNWEKISCHPNVTFDHIQSHMNLPWNWDAVSQNTNIRLEHVMAFPALSWCWDNLSRHIAVDDIIQTKKQLPWNWAFVSLNPTLKLHHVVENATLSWSWQVLVKHRAISVADIMAHDDLPWGSNAWYNVRYDINYNPNLTLADIMAHPTLVCRSPATPDKVSYAEWQECFMCEKKAFSMEWILMFPRAFFWYKYPASRHPGIKWEDVKKYHTLDWCLRGLSMNPSVPMRSILARKHLAWDWRAVCERGDFLDPLDAHEARAYLATKKICQQLYESFTNPAYLMCRRRLKKELESLAS
jgi:hypothetical protein